MTFEDDITMHYYELLFCWLKILSDENLARYFYCKKLKHKNERVEWTKELGIK